MGRMHTHRVTPSHTRTHGLVRRGSDQRNNAEWQQVWKTDALSAEYARLLVFVRGTTVAIGSSRGFVARERRWWACGVGRTSRFAVVGLLLGGMVFGAFGGSSIAGAAQTTRTWVGGGADNNWSTAGNWSSGDVPDGTGEAALFTDDPVGQTKLTPNLSANVTIGQLQFSATAPSYTITGSGTILSLSPAANYGGVGLVASGAGNQTIATTQVFLPPPKRGTSTERRP